MRRFPLLIAIMMMAIAGPAMAQVPLTDPLLQPIPIPTTGNSDLENYLKRAEARHQRMLELTVSSNQVANQALGIAITANATANDAKQKAEAATATANQAKQKADLALQQIASGAYAPAPQAAPNIHIVVHGSTATATSTSRAPAQRTTVVRPRYTYPAVYPYAYPVAEFYSPDRPAVGGFYYYDRVDSQGFIHQEKRYWYRNYPY